MNTYFSKTSPGILLRFSASGSDLNCASSFIGIIQIYACSYKRMTGKYWCHRFKKYQHNKRHFNEAMQATVYIFRHRTCCFMQINQLYVRWFGSFGWCMLYTVNILDTIRHIPCLCRMFRHLGWSAPLPKTADPELDTDSDHVYTDKGCRIFVGYDIMILRECLRSAFFASGY